MATRLEADKVRLLGRAIANGAGYDFPAIGGATGFTTASVSGSNIVGTLGTDGLSIGVPSYLTSAAGAGVAIQGSGAYSQNSGTIQFNNSNGITFGLSTNQLTASVETNYQTPGAYLTTAMLSNAVTISNIKISAGASSSNISAITFSNSNGVSFGYDGTNITATVKTDYQASGAYLTTAALSQDSSKYAGTSAGITGGSVTLNTSGIAINLPAYLTTAALSGQTSNFAGTNTSLATTAGTDLVMTLNTTGLTIAYPKWITTAQAPGAYLTTAALSQDSSKYAGTSTGITGGSVTLNTSGIAINLPAYLTTAALSADSSKYAGTSTGITGGSVTLNTSGIAINLPAYLTTAALSADSSKYAGTSTGITGGSVTLNTSGIAINLPAYLTTAALSADSSKYAGTSTGITGGSVTLNTSGIAINLPAYLTTAAISSGARSYWANLDQVNNVTTTMCQSNSFYVCPLTIQGNVSASYLRLLASFNFTSTSIATSAVNNASGASTAFSETLQWNAVMYSVGAGASSRSLQYYFSGSAGLTWAASVSQASTSNATNQSLTQRVTFPNEGANTDSISTQYSVSATNGPISTTQWSNLSAQRFLDIPFATSFSAGVYWLAVNRFSGTVGGKNLDCNASIYGVSNTNLTFANMNSATNLSNAAPYLGLGVWTTNAANTTSSIAFASISVTTSYMIPMVQFIRQA